MSDAGWDALRTGAWDTARELFEAAVAADPSAANLEGLSWAAWWGNDAPAMFAARERAYARYRETDDARGAARMATWLGTDHVDFRGELAVGEGWLGRARRLLEGIEPGPDHGWLWVHEAEKQMHIGDIAAARELGARAAQLGERLGRVDLQMMGLASEGMALVDEGDVDAGLARLGEAAAAAMGGEFEEIWAVGWTCCYLISACEQIRDYGRAGEWCGRLEEWSERMQVQFMARVCRATHAGLLVWRGTWAEAEHELSDCAQSLAEIRPPMAAAAVWRLGELRRRQGRLDEAEAIFQGVAEHSRALLGLGELCLDRGEPAGARDRAEQFLRETPARAVTLVAPGLELLVRAQAALGDADGAARCAAELAGIARRVRTESLGAAARHAEGAAALARGDLDAARAAFEDATRMFHRTGAPFEAARARTELARALIALGRPRDGAREAAAAAQTLRRIGADHAAARAEALQQDSAQRRHGSLTPREQEVLRLVAKGASDRAIAEQLVLSEHTVHRHVANILAKTGCSSRSAAVAHALTNEML